MIEDDQLQEITCADVEDRDLVSGYVSKTLPEADAETFERHYLGCSRCWEELQLAGEIRTATAESAAGAVGPVRRRFYLVLPFAAAAMVMLSVILWQRQQNSEPALSESLRSSSGQLQVEAIPDRASKLQVRWTPISGAARYRLRVSTSDGIPVLQRELETTTFDVGHTDLPPSPSALTIVVEAFDALGNPLAASPPITVRFPPQ